MALIILIYVKNTIYKIKIKRIRTDNGPEYFIVIIQNIIIIKANLQKHYIKKELFIKQRQFVRHNQMAKLKDFIKTEINFLNICRVTLKILINYES
jgi:hypothetical protein